MQKQNFYLYCRLSALLRQKMPSNYGRQSSALRYSSDKISHFRKHRFMSIKPSYRRHFMHPILTVVIVANTLLRMRLHRHLSHLFDYFFSQPHVRFLLSSIVWDNINAGTLQQEMWIKSKISLSKIPLLKMSRLKLMLLGYQEINLMCLRKGFFNKIALLCLCIHHPCRLFNLHTNVKQMLINV